MEEVNIVIVGAGPCGSFSALTLAKLGVKDVLVVEEHEEVGVPSHCAGHVSINGLKLLGLNLPSNVVENEIKGVVFYSPFGWELVIKRKAPISLVIDRSSFDKHIANVARRAGALLRLRSKARSLLIDEGSVKGVIIDKGEIIRSPIVIDAEGFPPALLKRSSLLNGELVAVRGAMVEVDRVDDVELDVVEVYLGRRYAPGFFAWLVPRRDGSAKVGLATELGNPRELLMKFVKEHPIASWKLRRGKIVRSILHLIPLGGPMSKTYADGLLVVGDAASQVKPTTGGGIVFGMLCAKMAAEVAYEALREGDFSRRFLSRYQVKWKKALGFDLAVMLFLRKMIHSLSDEELDRLLKSCAALGLKGALEDVEDVDFQGRSLLKLIRGPKNLSVVLYLIASSILFGLISSFRGRRFN